MQVAKAAEAKKATQSVAEPATANSDAMPKAEVKPNDEPKKKKKDKKKKDKKWTEALCGSLNP